MGIDALSDTYQYLFALLTRLQVPTSYEVPQPLEFIKRRSLLSRLKRSREYTQSTRL